METTSKKLNATGDLIIQDFGKRGYITKRGGEGFAGFLMCILLLFIQTIAIGFLIYICPRIFYIHIINI